MSKVQECAFALGQAIVESDEYKNMQVAEQAAMSDPAVTELMGKYMEAKNALGDLMCQSEPSAEEMARLGQEMDDIQQQLGAMPAVDAMTSSRQAFSEMMNQVNKILEYLITGEEPQQGGCSGNCSSCGGCH